MNEVMEMDDKVSNLLNDLMDNEDDYVLVEDCYNGKIFAKTMSHGGLNDKTNMDKIVAFLEKNGIEFERDGYRYLFIKVNESLEKFLNKKMQVQL